MGCCCCKHKEDAKEPKPEDPPKERKRRGCCCCKCCCKGRNTVVPGDAMDPFDAVLSSLPAKPSELDQASVPAQPANSGTTPAPAPAPDAGGEAEVKLPPRAPPKPIEPPPKRTQKDGDQDKAVENLLNNAYPTSMEDHAKAWRAMGGAKMMITNLDPAAMPSADMDNAAWSVPGNAKMKRKQVINLDVLDFPTHLIDNPGKKPYTLHVCEHFHPTADGCQIRLKVKLTGVFKGAAEDQQVLGDWDSGVVKPNYNQDGGVSAGGWVKLEHTFTELKGVRYISFEDVCQGGHSTHCSVRFCPP